MRINFRTQIIVTLILVIVGFMSSLWFDKDIYYNLAWAFTGLVFFINPVYPPNIVRLEVEMYCLLQMLTEHGKKPIGKQYGQNQEVHRM